MDYDRKGLQDKNLICRGGVGPERRKEVRIEMVEG